MGFIILLIFALIMGGMVGVAFHIIKKTDPNRVDTSTNGTIDTTQEFLPFNDIADSMIDMGNYSYRAVIECSSINYNLKTPGEQEVIELSYQRFLNSLNHAITIFIQTRKINYDKILENFKSETEEALKVFPQLRNYANHHYDYLKMQESYEMSNKEKKKYIVIPFDEANELTTGTDEEKKVYAKKELFTRCQIIIDSLTTLGVTAHILNSQELVELLFSVYNKDDSSISEEISNGRYTSMIVDGPNKIVSLNSSEKLDWILLESENRLKSELNDMRQPDYVKEMIADMIRKIESMRDEYSGNYKTY